DTGCGIAEEDIPHIFERFYKGKNAGKDSVGIGLALAKSIMEGQRGDILVSSKEGEGTEFRVRFYKTIV
ncbi:MAG: sensor histidine kinase, partial [Lachnospiraceae bacterium]|nr:sensor histidine kinase [Lachnospiraceae bacterium]